MTGGQHDDASRQSNKDLYGELAVWGILIQAAVLVVLVIGTVVAFQNISLLQQSLAEATRAGMLTRQAFVVDSRAVLNITAGGQRPSLPTTIEPTFEVRLPVTNTGKTPAFNVISLALAWVLRDRPTEDAWETRAERSELGIVFPAEVGRRVIVATDLGPEDLAHFKNGDNLWLSLRVSYCDAFGYAHRVERCISYNADGDNEYCGTYADAHTGQGDPDPECQLTTTP